MASREFLKILRSARLGDVSAQQKLAEAYLTGIFKTPIQPANALIWLEKSYLLIQKMGSDGFNSDNPQTLTIFQQIANIPLAQTFNSPAFHFGWTMFWQIADTNLEPKSTEAAK